MLATLTNQFISSELTDQSKQRYFSRLVGGRDRTALPIQRQLELQQILTEAILLANADTNSPINPEPFFQKIQTANTIGEQLVQSRKAMLKLSAMFLATRQQPDESSQRQRLKNDLLMTVEEARQLRNRAELNVISGEQSLISDAADDYRSAVACGDLGIARSCLRGLIAISSDTEEKQRFRRQLDFVNGGTIGPCGASTATKNSTVTNAELQQIIEFCRKIRRAAKGDVQSKDVLENAAQNRSPVTENIWAVLSAIATTT